MKNLLILVTLIGSGFSAISWDNPNNCYCPKCNVKLQSERKTEDKWFDCRHCGGDGYVTCAQWKWVTCSACRGTTCKGGWTTDNGKFCAYGKCDNSSCKGGKVQQQQLTENACECNYCEYNAHRGRYGEYKTGRTYDVLVCPRCRAEFSGCN